LVVAEAIHLVIIGLFNQWGIQRDLHRAMEYDFARFLDLNICASIEIFCFPRKIHRPIIGMDACRPNTTGFFCYRWEVFVWMGVSGMDVNCSDWIVMIMRFSFPTITPAGLACVLPAAAARLAEFIVD
jgi:hypothetical protein